MAIFHCSIKIISRGKGKSAVAAAAYRRGEKLTNNYDGIIHDYTRKSGVVHTKILLPKNAPKEFSDRSILWNAVEKIEKNKNSQLAREIEISLPKELSINQNISLVRQYVKENFVDAGMCADVCIHDKKDENPHAHILLTMRTFNDDGSWGAKAHKVNGKKICTTDWNEQTKAEEWRLTWAKSVNENLKNYNISEIIDHRSYARQGVEKIPTIHLGVAATQMERRGIVTERDNLNREIEITNKQLRQLKARINHLQNWLKVERENAPPTLQEVFAEIFNREQNQHRYQQLNTIQLASKTLNFITENKIRNLDDLEKVVGKMYENFGDVREKLKPLDRRIKTLDEHLKYSENFKEHRKLNGVYKDLQARYKVLKNNKGFFVERKAEKARIGLEEFYEENRAGLTLFVAAENYLKGVLQEHYDPIKLPPVTKWKEEKAQLTGKKNALYRQYYNLKEEVQNAETIKRYAEKVLKEVEPQQRRRAKSHDLEL